MKELMKHIRHTKILLQLLMIVGGALCTNILTLSAQSDSVTLEIVRITPDEAKKRLLVEVNATVAASKTMNDEDFNATVLKFTETVGEEANAMSPAARPYIMGIEDVSRTNKGTFLVRLSSPRGFPEKRKVYNGDDRTLTVTLTWNPKDIVRSKAFSIGTPSNPVNFMDVPWMVVILLGMVIVTAFLILLSLALPGWTKLQFSRNYIQRYKKIKEAGRRRMDPITGDEFGDDELVVTRCEQWHSLDSWEYNHFQCVNYPDCQNRAMPCTDGETLQTESYQFFTQQGIFKNLNWVWFGSLGGLISWGIWALLTNFALGPYRSLMSNISQSADYQVARDSMMGFSLGLGLVFALAWVEDKGQSSDSSWGRVILKALIGGVISLLVFLLGFLIYQGLDLENGFIGGMISWVLFGIFLGTILSIWSTIEISRGIPGGAIAALAAYLIFYGISQLFDSFEMAKMASFIILGAILGLIVVSVVTRLEDFELEYISPQKYSRVNPISKWLKADMDIFIGSDTSCYVFVKWPDNEVAPKHAKLSYDGNAVYLEPYAETLIGNRILPLNKPYELQNGDIIRLGRTSVSRMKFIARFLDD